jgi:hypothetical protein
LGEKMNAHASPEEFRTFVATLCAASALPVSKIQAECDEHEWQVDLSSGGRHFRFGSEMREGFFCYESTPESPKDFAPQFAGYIRGDRERLIYESIVMVRFAILNPSYQGSVTRII